MKSSFPFWTSKTNLSRASRFLFGRQQRGTARSLSSTAEQQQRVETTVDSKGICHVVLNRPDKLNALDLAMFEAIAETASNLRKDRSIRAVILRGKGRAFCTGIDVVRTYSISKSFEAVV
jgi:1,4-dihydroxy-2-naphthoyl-CoA synthase